jgi:hypothetical protein
MRSFGLSALAFILIAYGLYCGRANDDQEAKSNDGRSPAALEVSRERLKPKDEMKPRSKMAPDPAGDVRIEDHIFPKLKSFEKLVRRHDHGRPMTAKEFNREVKRLTRNYRYIDYHYRERLVEYRYRNFMDSRSISFGDRLTRYIRSEMVNHPDGKFVFQDQKIYGALSDPELDFEMPVCVLQVEHWNRAGSAVDMRIGVDHVIYPIFGERHFKSVRILARGGKFDITPVSLDCGFISDTEWSDKYKLLEYLHVYATLPYSDDY